MYIPTVSATRSHNLTSIRLIVHVDDDRQGGGSLEFVGTWSSYADFPSGYILINTIERGAWVVRIQDPVV